MLGHTSTYYSGRRRIPAHKLIDEDKEKYLSYYYTDNQVCTFNSPEIEFEKIKNEAIKSKKLIKNYYRPYEKNNSSSSDEDSYDEEELINEALNNEENEKNEYYNELMEKEKKNSNDLKQISQINATFEENMKEDSPIDEIKNTYVKNNKYNKKKSSS